MGPVEPGLLFSPTRFFIKSSSFWRSCSALAGVGDTSYNQQLDMNVPFRGDCVHHLSSLYSASTQKLLLFESLAAASALQA